MRFSRRICGCRRCVGTRRTGRSTPPRSRPPDRSWSRSGREINQYSAELQGNHLAQSLWNKILDVNIYAKLNIRCQSLPNAKHNRLVHQGVPDEHFVQDWDKCNLPGYYVVPLEFIMRLWITLTVQSASWAIKDIVPGAKLVRRQNSAANRTSMEYWGS